MVKGVILESGKYYLISKGKKRQRVVLPYVILVPNKKPHTPIKKRIFEVVELGNHVIKLKTKRIIVKREP